jgi:hypothetical protein
MSAVADSSANEAAAHLERRLDVVTARRCIDRTPHPPPAVGDHSSQTHNDLSLLLF